MLSPPITEDFVCEELQWYPRQSLKTLFVRGRNVIPPRITEDFVCDGPQFYPPPITEDFVWSRNVIPR